MPRFLIGTIVYDLNVVGRCTFVGVELDSTCVTREAAWKPDLLDLNTLYLARRISRSCVILTVQNSQSLSLEAVDESPRVSPTDVCTQNCRCARALPHMGNDNRTHSAAYVVFFSIFQLDFSKWSSGLLASVKVHHQCRCTFRRRYLLTPLAIS